MTPTTLLRQATLFSKLSQDPNAAIQQAITDSLRGIPGAKLLDMQISSGDKRVDVKIEVPAKHSFTASQLGQTLSQVIQQVAPGFKVVPILSFTTKQAQDLQAAAKATILQALKGNKLLGFAFQPQTKTIMVEVQKFNDKTTTQQLSDYLTEQVQTVAPGFKVVATLTTPTHQ